MLKTCRDHFDPQGQTYCVVGVYTVNAEHVRIGLQIHSLAKRGPLKSEALVVAVCIHSKSREMPVIVLPIDIARKSAKLSNINAIQNKPFHSH